MYEWICPKCGEKFGLPDAVRKHQDAGCSPVLVERHRIRTTVAGWRDEAMKFRDETPVKDGMTYHLENARVFAHQRVLDLLDKPGGV